MERIYLFTNLSNPQQSQASLYEAYKMQWLAAHSFTITDVLKEFSHYLSEVDPHGEDDIDTSISNWENDVGMDGSIWVCFHEWLQDQGPSAQFCAKMEARDWNIIAEELASDGYRTFVFRWVSPQNVPCNIQIHMDGKTEETQLYDIAYDFDIDSWVKKCITEMDIKNLPSVADMLDAGHNIKNELLQASEDPGYK